MSEDSSDVKPKIAPVPWGVKLALLTFIATITFSSAVSYSSIKLLSSANFAQARENSIIYFLSLSSMGLVMWLFLRSRKISIKQFFGKFRLSTPFVATAFILPYLIASSFVQTALEHIKGYNPDQTQDLGISGVRGITMLMAFVAICVLTPIVEETLFRGILYRGFKSSWPRYVSALIASLIFGLAHGQWNVGADTFVLSVFMIIAMEATGSMWTNIMMHAIKNSIAFLYVYVLVK